jgi:hypothetical protein
MDVHQESVRARGLIRVQHGPHSRQTRRRAVKASEPHMNFARLEFHWISRSFHDSDYTGIDRTYINLRSRACRLFLFFGSSCFRNDSSSSELNQQSLGDLESGGPEVYEVPVASAARFART